MVLFAPIRASFYRVREFADIDEARKFCEGLALFPMRIYVRRIFCEKAGPSDTNGNRSHKYMVLWKEMEECYYEMLEFEEFRDAVKCTSKIKARLQDTNRAHLDETLRVSAFTLAGQWNIASKP